MKRSDALGIQRSSKASVVTLEDVSRRSALSFVQLSLQSFHLFHQAQEFFSEGRQAILDVRRDFGKLDALENSCAREVTQPVGEHFGAYAVDVSFEGAGTIHATSDRPQDTNRPSATNHVFQQYLDPTGV
jgi:hypothetical protein